MSLSTQPYKGARDFYPEDKRVQKYLFTTMRSVVERYGYEEYDAPVLEPLELYLAKSSEEIVTEQTYAFNDRGGRKVAIRPEMTPTVSRMVAAKRQELAYPLRWYSIPNLWRYERPQRGRLREHWQLNVDVFGIESIEAEIEVIQLANDILKTYGAQPSMYEIKLNSRVFINAVLHEYLGLDDVQTGSLIRLIDRMHKMDESAFLARADALFTPEQRSAGKVELLQNILRVKTIQELPEEVRDRASVARLDGVMKRLASVGITNAGFDMTLMRGFDYYTDIVFEVFDTNPDNKRSMFGGGRYDGLVSQFGVEAVPTVGFGMGDVTLLNFLESHTLLPELKPETDAYVVLIGDVATAAAPFFSKLRSQGVNIAVDMTGRKLDKQLKTAVKKGIRYAIIIGENELTSETYTLKDLQTGQEEQHGIDRLIGLTKDYRHHTDLTNLD